MGRSQRIDGVYCMPISAGPTMFVTLGRPMRTVNIFLLAGTTMTAACSTPDRYPSLMIRDAERPGATMEATPSEPPAGIPQTQVPADLRERLAVLRERAGEAHANFLAYAPTAARTVRAARGMPITSDLRASAEIALATLDSARSNTGAALAELDELVAQTSIALGPSEEVRNVREDVLELLGEEDAFVAELAAVLD